MYICFRHTVTAHIIDNVSVTFMCIGNQKNSHSLYCGGRELNMQCLRGRPVCFEAVVRYVHMYDCLGDLHSNCK